MQITREEIGFFVNLNLNMFVLEQFLLCTIFKKVRAVLYLRAYRFALWEARIGSYKGHLQ